jgi:tetratricopeptide (TPR) repeat protein
MIPRAKNSSCIHFLVLAALLLPAAPLAAPLAAQTPARQAASPQDQAMELVKEGRKLNREGKQAEALDAYRRALKLSPDLYAAHLGAGMALDLMGRYAEAREDLAKAIQLAPAKSKPQAQKVMAISYAFTRQPKEAEKYEQQAFDTQTAAQDFYAAGETADELARIYLESGDLNAAAKWYKLGHDTGLRKPGLSDAERALWEFRWEHAEARIAARHHRRAEAEKHVAAAKAILDKAYPWQKQQAEYFPYLTGYVAFYLGDYKAALTDLQKANQRDPFILSLLAQTCEKLGEQSQATGYYRKVLESNAHNPTNAFARPLARKKLGAAGSGH